MTVFTPDGEIVFCTSDNEIGNFNKNNYFHNIVAKGQIITNLVHRDEESLENKMMGVDVVETYIPILPEKVLKDRK